MPVIEDLGMSEFELKLSHCMYGDKSVLQPVRHRNLLPDQYRIHAGLHNREDKCHLCNELALRNFMDGKKSDGDRIPALVALHYWMHYGGTWRDFNEWYLPWHDVLCPKNDWSAGYDTYDGYFSDYILNKKWLTDGSTETHRPETDSEFKYLGRKTRLLIAKPAKPWTHHMNCGPSIF
jgi:hypothetical protein